MTDSTGRLLLTETERESLRGPQHIAREAYTALIGRISLRPTRGESQNEKVVCAGLLSAAIAIGVFLVTMSSTGMAGQGWYLVGPPEHRLPKDVRGGPEGSWSEVRARVLKQLPLSEWATYQAFDTAEACEAERESRIHDGLRMLRDKARTPGDPIAQDTLIYWSLAMCVASDDVRLGPKK